jgi:hypothetical protein
VKESIKRELPALLCEDLAFRDQILALTRQHHRTRGETEHWFHVLPGEQRWDRAEQGGDGGQVSHCGSRPSRKSGAKRSSWETKRS